MTWFQQSSINWRDFFLFLLFSCWLERQIMQEHNRRSRRSSCLQSVNHYSCWVSDSCGCCNELYYWLKFIWFTPNDSLVWVTQSHQVRIKSICIQKLHSLTNWFMPIHWFIPNPMHFTEIERNCEEKSKYLTINNTLWCGRGYGKKGLLGGKDKLIWPLNNIYSYRCNWYSGCRTVTRRLVSWWVSEGIMTQDFMELTPPKTINQQNMVNL